MATPDPTVWAAGDYAEIAATIVDCAEATIAAAGVAAGQDVLDVATGTGNAALAAAGRDARVTAIDLTPELVEIARARAAEESADIRFDVGDAQALPYEDASFDAVTSVFGAMFAPDHERTADELMRVCRPGGAIAIAAWTPQGLNGQMFATMAPHLPPPPPGFQPPTLWGTEEHVRRLFPGAPSIESTLLRADFNIEAESPAAWVDFLSRTIGPVALAKRALEADGRWEPLEADLIALFERSNEAGDGRMRARPEYLLTVVRR